MKWVFRIIFLTILVFIITMIVGATRLDTLSTERSLIIDAAPGDVFPYFNDLSQHRDWSPWVSGDPDVEIVYGGPIKGRGQSMAWRSSGVVGNGSQEITESQDGSFVRADIVTGERSGFVTYALSETVDGELVSLIGFEIALGGFPFVQRLFAGRDKADLDAKLEQGLSTLKALAQSDLELEEL